MPPSLKVVVHDNIDQAREESERWHEKEAQGLIEPLKCPHRIGIGIEVTVKEKDDGAKIVSFENLNF